MVRKLAQLVLLLLVTPGVVLLGPAGAANAATTKAAKPGLLQSAWFWQTAYEQANPPVAAGPLPATEPSGVPKGDLAVASTAGDGSSSKMSVVAFGIDALEPGATVDTFTVTLTVDSGNGAVNASPGAAPVVACLPTRLWTPAEGGDYTNEPSVDCSQKVTPTVKGSSYTFSIPAIAQSWVGGDNLGVAFVNDPKNTQPFQVVFAGGKNVKAAMTYTPPAPVAAGGSGQPRAGGVAPSAGAADSSPAAASAPPPVDVPLPAPAATSAAAAVPPQAPQVAPTTPAPLAAAPVVRSRPAPSGPGTAFWLGAIGIAALLVTAAVVLRDSEIPVPTATTTRLSRVLREREEQRRTHADTTATLALRRV